MALVAGVGGWQLMALKTAAGGTSGQNGFANVAAFLDHLATYCIWLAIPLGVLGLIVAGGLLMSGNQEGSSMLAKVAIGVGIVMLSKGILA
jgi:hypothetical protein